MTLLLTTLMVQAACGAQTPPQPKTREFSIDFKWGDRTKSLPRTVIVVGPTKDLGTAYIGDTLILQIRTDVAGSFELEGATLRLAAGETGTLTVTAHFPEGYQGEGGIDSVWFTPDPAAGFGDPQVRVADVTVRRR